MNILVVGGKRRQPPGAQVQICLGVPPLLLRLTGEEGLDIAEARAARIHRAGHSRGPIGGKLQGDPCAAGIEVGVKINQARRDCLAAHIDLVRGVLRDVGGDFADDAIFDGNIGHLSPQAAGDVIQRAVS